ncbi:hypothetical protein [Halobellus litoreus]|uniref:Uncharacterized protein n=1 Tax=Halobellus litoreus TaxID=755310 RepID=A0ABD6E4D5_9EURY|nr:hypothetical protein [Halobellus litoreus]
MSVDNCEGKDPHDAIEPLSKIANAKKNDLDSFAADLETGDATEEDYWLLIRGIAGSHPAIADAAHVNIDIQDKIAAGALDEAFKGIYDLTVEGGSRLAAQQLRLAADELAAADPDTVLDAFAVERDGLGSSQIDVSERTTAHAYDDEDGAVLVDTAALDRNPDRNRTNLSVEDARALRDDLDEALDAIAAERTRYDREAEE